MVAISIFLRFPWDMVAIMLHKVHKLKDIEMCDLLAQGLILREIKIDCMKYLIAHKRRGWQSAVLEYLA